MKNFEKRRDRFELFESMESPFLNITFRLEVPDFRPYCKEQNLPVFHFFLYYLFKALMNVENFRYRIYDGEVILIDQIIPSYTILNEENIFNFTRFEFSDDVNEFIRRSLAAKDESMKAPKLIHSASDVSARDLKDYVFITSLPWLDFTSIQHPVGRFKSADIPSLAWGKFSTLPDGRLSMPFSVQAHHGFVDGYHIHLLAEEIGRVLAEAIK